MAASKKKLKRGFRRESRSKLFTGIAWYSPNQWAKLRQVASDPEKLEATYEEWLAIFERTFKVLTAKGVILTKIPVDVRQLVEWCKEQNAAIDGSARARYVAYVMGQQQLVQNLEPEIE
jgi:hypothetical protein